MGKDNPWTEKELITLRQLCAQRKTWEQIQFCMPHHSMHYIRKKMRELGVSTGNFSQRGHKPAKFILNDEVSEFLETL